MKILINSVPMLQGELHLNLSKFLVFAGGELTIGAPQRKNFYNLRKNYGQIISRNFFFAPKGRYQ